MSTEKIKISVGHPTFGSGGSEARCMQIMQALKDEFDITLVTTRSVDLDRMNAFYGTSIRLGEISVRLAPVPFFMRHNSRISALRGALYSRFSRRIGKEFDICISTYNLTYWGKPGVHFIADLTWDMALSFQYDDEPMLRRSLIYGDHLLRKCYLFICKWVEGGRAKDKADYFNGDEEIIANSQWSAQIIKNRYDYDCDKIIYPAVQDTFKNIPWSKKKTAFFSIGRITPEKRIERQIDILEKVRGLGHDIQFHLIGHVGSDNYGKKIKKKISGKSWIIMEGKKFGPAKERLLTGIKFAIHTRSHEAFGITVAEMVKAGCIPFVPNSGGPTEIVPYKELQFESVEDAIEKIDCVLRDKNKQHDLLQKLEIQKHLFSATQFRRQVKNFIYSIAKN